MTEENRRHLLDILNKALTAGAIPQDWQKVLVVEIYKTKGSLTDPNNYRPISLSSTAYKLMARIVQQRLEKAIDDRLRPLQYGFRAGRSTSQPVHILRRLLERAERTNTSLYVLLLDWKQAFDRVSVKALEVAMQRCGVPQAMIALIRSIYTSQLFQVKATSNTSEVLCAKSGIRRGCPLSPCLFLMVHSMILRDVGSQLLENGGMMPWVFGQQTNFYELAYADDTALVALTEITAAHSNLALNWDKCLLLKSHYSRNPVRNLTGEEIKEVEHAKYLGVMLSRNGSSRKDIRERLAKARKHFNTLHHFGGTQGSLYTGSSVSTTRSLCPCWSVDWSPQPSHGRTFTGWSPSIRRHCGRCTASHPHSTRRFWTPHSQPLPTNNYDNKPHSHPSHITFTGHN